MIADAAAWPTAHERLGAVWKFRDAAIGNRFSHDYQNETVIYQQTEKGEAAASQTYVDSDYSDE